MTLTTLSYKFNFDNLQLIDVQTPEEYKEAYIGSAKNIDFYSGKFNVEFNKLHKELLIYI